MMCGGDTTCWLLSSCPLERRTMPTPDRDAKLDMSTRHCCVSGATHLTPHPYSLLSALPAGVGHDDVQLAVLRPRHRRLPVVQPQAGRLLLLLLRRLVLPQVLLGRHRAAQPQLPQVGRHGCLRGCMET